MEVTLLTGFLGAGKTTTVKHLLRSPEWREQSGVIVNDLSELEVDGELIRLTDAVSERTGRLASINAGSIADLRRAEFTAALATMHARGITRVLVEASGSTHPGPVIAAIRSLPAARLHGVVALVDARALHRDYDGGPGLAQAILAAERHGEATVETLLAAQLRAAGAIALSKLDLVPEPDHALLRATLQAINPHARLTECPHGRLDPAALTVPPPVEIPDSSAPAEPEDYDIGTSILRDPRPFHPERLHRLFHTQLGLGIFRSKGFLWLASRPDDVLLWNQAGGTLGLELLGTWRAALLTGGRLLPEEKSALAQLLADAHPDFGDRINELTLIGRARDRAIFLAGLHDCLCTPVEVRAWRNGAAFPDPWPTRLRVSA